MSTDTDIQQHVYRFTAEHGKPPTSAAVASALGVEPSDVLAAFRRINARRLLVLAPQTGEIVMAPPFSAVPTSFRVEANGRAYFANCVWDSFGVAAALHSDAAIESSCACCGEPMSLRIAGGQPVPEPAVAHFEVPAAHWWDDITYT
jgi:hypothetical protein